MARDLSYKDNRSSAYLSEFSDAKYNREPVKITETEMVTRTDGDYTFERLDIKQLIRLLEQHDRDIRELKQTVKSLEGQLEYVYKNGVDGYTTKIQEIRVANPKPE